MKGVGLVAGFQGVGSWRLRNKATEAVKAASGIVAASASTRLIQVIQQLQETMYLRKKSMEQCGKWSDSTQVHTLRTTLLNTPIHGKPQHDRLFNLKSTTNDQLNSKLQMTNLEFDDIGADFFHDSGNVITLVYSFP